MAFAAAPFASYDIQSIDDDGESILIEVKATTSQDPAGPFDISAGELLTAVQYRTATTSTG